MKISITVITADYRGYHSKEIEIPIECDIDKSFKDVIELIYKNYNQLDFIKICKIEELK